MFNSYVRFLTLTCICFFSSLCAELIEIQTMQQAIPFLKKESLIIFDIDNTLMHPAQELGNDQWFYRQIQRYEKIGFPRANALDQALSEWTAIQNITQVVAVEEDSKDIIRELQNQNITVMGLTTRGLGLSTRTAEHLYHLGIDLSLTAPTHREIFFWNSQGVLFRRGILFTSGTHKGKALRKFLDQIQLKPTSVVFINDKTSHIKELETYCLEENIPFIGLRYGFLDDKVANFRTELADIQFRHFGKILSDQEAEDILKAELSEAAL